MSLFCTAVIACLHAFLYGIPRSLLLRVYKKKSKDDQCPTLLSHIPAKIRIFSTPKLQRIVDVAMFFHHRAFIKK